MNVSSSLPDPRAVDGRRLDVARTLAPVTRAIGLARLTRAALLGLAAGAAGGAGILVAAHLRTFDLALPAAVIVAAVGLLAGAAIALARWPRPMEAARVADLQFQLDDRLTTALELRGSEAPVAFLQSRELERRIDGVPLSRYKGRWLRRSEGGMVVLAALAFAGALALGPPSAAHHAAATGPSSSKAVRHAAAKQVQKLASQLHLGLTPAQLQSPAMRKLDAALARLRHRLLKASSPRASLRAISATQQQLHQLARGLHPVSSKAVSQLNSSLSRYLNRGQAGNNRKSSAASSNAATARALNRLAQSLSHLTPAQRAALAQALARAANATPNNALRQALRQAASALANNQPQSAQTAMQQIAQMLAQSSAAQTALSRTGVAQTQLNALKNQVAGQAPATVAGTGAPPPSAPSSNGQGRQSTGANVPGQGSSKIPGLGKGAGQGQGARPGQGQGTGQRRGTAQGRGTGRGQGTGRGRGTGTGRGTAFGRGNGRGHGRGVGTAGRLGTAGRAGTAGAHGAGGQGAAARTRSGTTVTVFVPGKQGKGSTINWTGPNGAPQPGAVVPYQQVVGRYAASAHQALDRTALPPSLQGYVRRYFDTLSR